MAAEQPRRDRARRGSWPSLARPCGRVRRQSCVSSCASGAIDRWLAAHGLPECHMVDLPPAHLGRIVAAWSRPGPCRPAAATRWGWWPARRPCSWSGAISRIGSRRRAPHCSKPKTRFFARGARARARRDGVRRRARLQQLPDEHSRLRRTGARASMRATRSTTI